MIEDDYIDFLHSLVEGKIVRDDVTNKIVTVVQLGSNIIDDGVVVEDRSGKQYVRDVWDLSQV
jgi:hypothetical protein